MTNSEEVKIHFIRHGETSYSEIFPDLTDKGKKTIENSAFELSKLVKESPVTIISSPRARALGSATILKNILCQNNKILLEDGLRSMDVHDKDKANKIFEDYKDTSNRTPNIAYETDERFHSGCVFEKKQDIKRRFHQNILINFQEARKGAIEKNIINVTHYEVMHHLTRDIFGIYPENLWNSKKGPAHGEVLSFCLRLANGNNNLYSFEAKFRDDKIKGNASVKSNIIQFYDKIYF